MGGAGRANMRCLPGRTFVFSLQHQCQSGSQSCSIRSSAQQVHDLWNTTGHKSHDADHLRFLGFFFFPNMTCFFGSFFAWRLHQKMLMVHCERWARSGMSRLTRVHSNILHFALFCVFLFVCRSPENSVMGVIAFTCQNGCYRPEFWRITFETDVEHTYRM